MSMTKFLLDAAICNNYCTDFSLLYCVIFFYYFDNDSFDSNFSLILWVWFCTFKRRTALEAEHEIVSYHLLKANTLIGRSEQVESREVSLSLYKWPPRKLFIDIISCCPILPNICLTTLSDAWSRTFIFFKKEMADFYDWCVL